MRDSARGEDESLSPPADLNFRISAQRNFMKRTWKVPVGCLTVAVLCGFSAAQVTFKQVAINSGDTTSNGITSGDFNNDGVLDLVTVNGQSLSFYKGLGNGRLAAPMNQPL